MILTPIQIWIRPISLFQDGLRERGKPTGKFPGTLNLSHSIISELKRGTENRPPYSRW